MKRIYFLCNYLTKHLQVFLKIFEARVPNELIEPIDVQDQDGSHYGFHCVCDLLYVRLDFLCVRNMGGIEAELVVL